MEGKKEQERRGNNFAFEVWVQGGDEVLVFVFYNFGGEAFIEFPGNQG
jgi:hypothetical protein